MLQQAPPLRFLDSPLPFPTLLSFQNAHRGRPANLYGLVAGSQGVRQREQPRRRWADSRGRLCGWQGQRDSGIRVQGETFRRPRRGCGRPGGGHKGGGGVRGQVDCVLMMRAGGMIWCVVSSFGGEETARANHANRQVAGPASVPGGIESSAIAAN